MTVFITVDDRKGVLFNNRRQSRDEEVCKKILSVTGNSRLFMNEYSAKLFSDFDKQIEVCEDFLQKAEEGDCCFSEGECLKDWSGKIERLIVFKWNRHYPSDVKCDIDFNDWILVSEEEFAGKSHEKITMEEYRKVSR